ncbi:MAG TPA: SusC/RagA family TonB-linked outer membrane protein [Saprospiraceae bacterium]|nr:SusC/RagA family TonB-linked outer membrane protein [Saprospiraceae bacterium]HPI06336.1 SusC/RagA family TonB-linked outer membrane protein [Saprospiraceae bacterium]
MKQLLTTLLLMLAVCGTMMAQRKISGTVTGDDGETLIGATVAIKGVARGTLTDVGGKYALEVPDGATTLIVSYTGYKTQEIVLGVSNAIDVVLETGTNLSEVVITATGITRNKSDVVYANQTVNSDDLNAVTNKSVLNALQGKVAGVKIGSASGAVGASTRVVLRGETSLTQGNNALIVVDGVPVNNSTASAGAGSETVFGSTGKNGDRDNYVDFGNRGNDINPDDVESVTVLKGPAATTLYGSRGGSGVILITTKKGKSNEKPRITLTSSYSLEEAYVLFQNQEKYGSGYASCGGCGGGINIFMGENFAWGSEFDGRMLPWTAIPADADGNLIPLSNGKIEQLVRPYSAVKNNIQSFFDIGNTARTSLAISGGTDKSTYYVSYTNFNNEGIVHNTNLNKHNLLLNVGSQFSPKLRSDFSLSYSKLNQRGATEGGYPFGYSSGTPAMAFVTQTPSNIPFTEMRDYNSPYQDFKGFYGQYSINPYYILDNQEVRNTVDNVVSSVSLTYSPITSLSFTGKVSTNFITSNVTEKNPKFRYERALSWSDGELSDFEAPRSDGNFSLGSYKESTNRIIHLIYDAYGTFSKQLSDDFKLTTTLGFNSIEQGNRQVAGTTVGGLVIPGFYDLTNSSENPRSTAFSALYRIFGVYSNTSVGFRNWLFAEYSARQDFSSTLPAGKRGFFYQGGGFSIVPTNLPDFDAGPLSFLKFRGGLGSAGKDAPQYRLNSYFGFNPTILDLGDDYQVRFPFGGVPGARKLNIIGNPDLKPELSITSEAGVDLGFFKGRVELEYTFYYINSTNQIVDANIPWSSGYAFVPLNIGRMVNKGHELALRLNPVRTKMIDWKLYGSWSKNNNVVKEIIKNDVDNDELNIITNFLHFAGHGSLNLIAAEGLPFGTFKGTTYEYDPQGRIIVDAQGNPKRSAESKYLGSYQPDFLATLGTELTINKRLTVRALLDGKKGGVFYSATKLSTENNGTAITTLLNDRQPFVVENSVKEDGVGGFVANTTETDAYHFYRGAPAGNYLLDASYLKLREVAISYNIPTGKMGAFKGITVGLFAKNLKYWVAKENTFADPEVGGVGAASDAVGIETTTTPTSKSFGAELRLNF